MNLDHVTKITAVDLPRIGRIPLKNNCGGVGGCSDNILRGVSGSSLACPDIERAGEDASALLIVGSQADSILLVGHQVLDGVGAAGGARQGADLQGDVWQVGHLVADHVTQQVPIPRALFWWVPRGYNLLLLALCAEKVAWRAAWGCNM